MVHQGDMIECLLALCWKQEEDEGRVSDDYMRCRTALEAACLGVEKIWNENPDIWDLPSVLQLIMARGDLRVRVPNPTRPRGYRLQQEAYNHHKEMRNAMNHFRLGVLDILVARTLEGKGLVRKTILQFLLSESFVQRYSKAKAQDLGGPPSVSKSGSAGSRQQGMPSPSLRPLPSNDGPTQSTREVPRKEEWEVID